MRTIKQTAQFKRDLKRASKGKHSSTLEEPLMQILTALAADEQLAQKHYDHALTGEWKDCRDCHIKPDLVLIYQKNDEDNLFLIRLGSHSELGL